MKKLLWVLILLLLPLTVLAEDAESRRDGAFFYQIADGEAVLTGCDWDAMPGQLIEKALAFRDEVIASGKTVHSFVSTSLILVHTQEGKTIEYHKCYVPFQDC